MASKVHKDTGHTGVHFAVLNHGIKVPGVRQCFRQMMADLSYAGLDRQRRVPGASIAWIESHGLSGLGISKARVDELCMRNAVNEFSCGQSAEPSLFSDQSAARCAFNFGKQRKFIVVVGQRQHRRFAQSRT